MTTSLTKMFYKYNNYNFKDDYIEIVKQYLLNKKLPDNFSDAQKTHLKIQYKDFTINNNNIVFKPLNLIVVKESDKQNILKELYDDPTIGLGSGVKSFYNKVRDRYLGIKRDDIITFLNSQEAYQLTKKEKPVINRPIIGKYPNHRWAIDLIDMNYYKSSNNNYKWILTVIDFFSKKVFAKGMKDKTAETTKDALDSICSDNTYPLIIQSDNGGEFIGQEMKDWATDNKVRLVRTLSYTPTSNGLIENFNNLLRKMIREGFIRNNNLNWVDHLDDYVENRNNSRHSTTNSR